MPSSDTVFLSMLAFVPLSLLSAFFGANPVLVFAFSALSVVPLSKYIGEATEELSGRTTPAVGGFLNATFGNAADLIIAFMALRAGLVEVVKASIIGAVLSNLLFVLGFAMLLGGIRHVKQTFNASAARASGSTLLLAVMALSIPGIFSIASPSPDSSRALSIAVAALLLVAYAASLLFSLWTHRHFYADEPVEHPARWSLAKSVIVLCAATAAIALISEILIGSIKPTVADFGWSELFVGGVIFALVGNVAEHLSAVRAALKNNMNLSFQIAIGSTAQIAMFVAPVLVIAGFFLGRPLGFDFTALELAALFMSATVVHSIVEDGESNWFEGMLLLVAYGVIAAAFFLA